MKTKFENRESKLAKAMDNIAVNLQQEYGSQLTIIKKFWYCNQIGTFQ